MTDVFISYSRKDIEIVKNIVEVLGEEGIDSWVDWEVIPISSDWLTEIFKGIENSDVVIYVLSPDSAISETCMREIDHGVKNGKRILPLVVRKEGIDPATLPDFVKSVNWLYLESESDGFEGAIQKLIAAIRTDYDWSKTHTRLQVLALDWERKNRLSSYLLRGSELADAERAFANSTYKEPPMTNLQAEFIFASRQDALRRQRQTLIFLTILPVFFCLGGYLLGRSNFTQQVNVSMNTSLIVAGSIGLLAIGTISGYMSRNLFQRPVILLAKTASPERSTEEPDALLPETVFISYKRDDWNDFVRPLVIQLRKNGYKIWIDQNNLEVSENWLDEINKALKVCQRLVLCVSPDSLESKYVKMEYRFFLHYEKTIFPIELKKAELPAELLGLQKIPFTQMDDLTDKLRSVGRTER